MYPNDFGRDSRDLTKVVELFASLSNKELQELLEDDAKLDTFVRDTKQVDGLDDINTEKEMIIASNRSLAEFNLSRGEELARGRLQMMKSSEEGQKLLDNIEELAAKLKEKSGSTNSETVLALLQTAAAEMEEESEKVAERFLEGDIDVDQFLDQFQTTRKIMHLRRVKADKMSDLLTKKPASQGPAPYPTFPTGNVHYYPPAPPVGGAPYPMGNFNMPLPYPTPRY